MDHSHDDHDLGLREDLPRMIGRRRLIALLGGLGLASASGLPAAAARCVALPWETAGPFPGDGSNAREEQVVNVLAREGVVRSDLRYSLGDGGPPAAGARLDLKLTLLDAASCAPLAGHAIYVWHCDAEGSYSLYDRPEASYLRGVGATDAAGRVGFTTIVPGCYAGRWPHVHFEVFESAAAAMSGAGSRLTAQMALPGEVAAATYAQDGRYAGSARNLHRISLARDNVFADNSAATIAQQTLAMSGDVRQGFRGTLAIPVDLDADRDVSMSPPPGEPGAGMPPRGAP